MFKDLTSEQSARLVKAKTTLYVRAGLSEADAEEAARREVEVVQFWFPDPPDEDAESAVEEYILDMERFAASPPLEGVRID